MESETIPSEEHKSDSPFGATLFKLPFKTTLSNKSSLYNTIQVNTYYQCAKIV